MSPSAAPHGEQEGDRYMLMHARDVVKIQPAVWSGVIFGSQTCHSFNCMPC